MSTPGSPLSRRDSLKRAAGALALGIGAPAALAANSDDVAFIGNKVTFYDRPGGRPVAWAEFPREFEDALKRPGAFSYLKVEFPEGESINYRARPER